MNNASPISQGENGLWHAHKPGPTECWREPSAELNWYCPYSTQEEAWKAAERMMAIALPDPKRINACLQTFPIIHYIQSRGYRIFAVRRRRTGQWEQHAMGKWSEESVFTIGRLCGEINHAYMMLADGLIDFAAPTA